MYFCIGFHLTPSMTWKSNAILFIFLSCASLAWAGDPDKKILQAVKACLKREGFDYEDVKEDQFKIIDEEGEVTDFCGELDSKGIKEDVIDCGSNTVFLEKVSDGKNNYPSLTIVLLAPQEPKESKAELLRSGYLTCWECEKVIVDRFLFGECETCQGTRKIPLNKRESMFVHQVLEAINH